MYLCAVLRRLCIVPPALTCDRPRDYIIDDQKKHLRSMGTRQACAAADVIRRVQVLEKEKLEVVSSVPFIGEVV